jgi:uncharacterized glyoxalase superfamily protein PhnB
MKFAYTILYVPDVEQAVSFYEKAFGFKRKFVAPGNEYGELNTGDTTLSFATFEMGKSNVPGGFRQPAAGELPVGVELAFTTADVEKQYDAAVKAGAKSVAKPEVKPWGQTVSYVSDNNGYLVEICSPVD